jgi:hypothetical protein
VEEAAVDVDDLAMANKNDIWFARQTLSVERIPKAHSMNNRSNDHLWSRIAAANTRHVEASLLRC